MAYDFTPKSTPGYQSPNRRLSQMLMQGQIGQPRQQRRGKTGQIADFIQSGLGAYLMSKDMGQQQAAQQAFIRGATGPGLGAGTPGGMVDIGGEGVYGSYGQQSPAGGVGGMKGAMAALQGMTGNPHAQHRLQSLLMQDLSRGQKEEQRLREHETAKDLYRFQQKEKVFQPKIPVPGRDVPFGPKVQAQKIAARQAGKTTWGAMPEEPGMMVSSLGQRQAVPQTAQQQFQGKLKMEAAQAQAEAKRGLPQMQQKTQESIANIKALMGHPGMKGMVGAPDTLSGLFYKVTGTPLAGTKEADFDARLKQVGGQQFLQALDSLKGTGAITEVEGKKATVALSRLTETGQSEESYRQAGEELIAILNAGAARAGVAAGQPAMGMGQAAMPPGAGGQRPTAMGQGPQLSPSVAAMLPPGGQGQAVMPQPAMGAEQSMVMPQGLQVPPGVRGPGVGGMGDSDLMSMYNRPPSPAGVVPLAPPAQGQQPLGRGVHISTREEFEALPSGTVYKIRGSVNAMRKP